MSTAVRAIDSCRETAGATPPTQHSDSLLRDTDLSNPNHSALAACSKGHDVRLAATTPQSDKPGEPHPLKLLDPNNEAEFSDYASKQMRRELGLKPDASSKDFIDGYIGAAVGNYRKLPEAAQEQVGQLNGLDPKKSYTDKELQDIFTQNLKKYHGVETGPDQDKRLEGAIIHELFQQTKDIERLREFYQKDH